MLLTTLKEAEKVNNLHSSLYNVWGLYYSNLGKFQESVNYFSKSATLNSKNVFALNNLGLAYLKLGKFQEASIEGEKSGSIKSTLLLRLQQLRDCKYENIGELDKAIVMHIIRL